MWLQCGHFQHYTQFGLLHASDQELARPVRNCESHKSCQFKSKNRNWDVKIIKSKSKCTFSSSSSVHIVGGIAQGGHC